MSVELVDRNHPQAQMIDIQQEYNNTVIALQSVLGESKVPTVMLIGMLQCTCMDMMHQMQIAELNAAKNRAEAEGQIQ